MNDIPLACIVCQCEVNASALSACMKGHQQCQVCTIRLNGICGICTTPIEFQTTSIGPEAFITELPNTEFVSNDPQDFWNPQQIPNPDSNNYFQNIIVIDENMSQETSNKYAADDQNIYNSTSFNNPINEQEFVSPSLLDILRNVHEAKCSRNCTNFDYCIRQILWEQFDYNQATYCSVPDENFNSGSMLDILQNIHRNSCDNMQCENMVCCMSSTLKHLIEKQTTNVKDMLKDSCKEIISSKDANKLSAEMNHLKELEYVHNECSAMIDHKSNVVRACYRNDKNFDLKAKHAQPQYEVITTFSTISKKSQKDFSVPFDFESNAKTASIIECPLLECNVTVEDRYLLKHFQEKHKQLELLLIQPNKQSLFFIDPSILECNEVNCIASYMIPNVFNFTDETKLENRGLPILIMVCRTNFNDLPCSGLPKKFSEQQQKQYTETDEEIIDAEVAETVYGVKKKLKSEPVKWNSDDILIICPVAPIPKSKAICTILVTFAPEKPTANFSASFCMRSIRNFTTIRELVGSPDTICLTSVDIATLTGNGRHVIHCQLMCRF